MKSSFRNELKTVLKVARWEFFLKMFTSIFIRGLLLIIPILLSEVVNYVTKGLYDEAVLVCVSMICIVGVYRFFEGYNQKAYYKLYNKLFSYYNNLALTKTKDNSLFSLSRFTPAQYSNIVITDVDIISGFFTAGVIRVVQVIEFLVIFIYFFSIDIYIFICCIVVSIIMFIVSIKSCDKIQQLNEKRKLALDNMSSSTFDYFGSIKEIKGFNIFDKVYSLTEPKVKKYLDCHGNYNVSFNCNNHFNLFVFEVFRLLSVLFAIFEVKNGHMEVGALLLIYNYYQKIIDNFTTILTINVEYRNFKVSLSRFNKLIEYSKIKKNGIKLDKHEINGTISFSKILYGFRDNPTLNNTSFMFKENSITVLTGRDEAAQNGIYDLLMKFNRQHEGNITIDNIDINDIDDDSYFTLISSVRRNTVLFDVSIKENFTMINPNFDKVQNICKMIGLDSEINKLPNGYDTILDDNTPITQSTKELIVIARTLLKESKIILFDNLINILDDKFEKKLLDVLKELKKNHTIVIITHSKEIIDRADYIYDVSDKVVVVNK